MTLHEAAGPPEPLPHPVDVSVIVPVLDEEAHLAEVLAGIVRQTFPGSIEMLLIDGGSRDRSREIIRDLAEQDERIQLLDNPQRLIPQALNIGLAHAHGTYVVRMDAHTHYPPDYIQLGVERLMRGDDVVHVSGPQVAVGTDAASRRVALALASPLGVGGATFRDGGATEEFEVETGFTGVWRRDTLLEAGGWDEDFPTDEDCELAFRLHERGGRHVCVPAMAAHYTPRNSLRRLAKQYHSYGRSKVRTFHRHPTSMRPSHVLPPVVTATVAVAVVGPRPVRTLARAGTAVYAGALTAGALALAVRAGRHGLTAPPVWLTMHLSYGIGMLGGMAREGIPARAISNALRRVGR